MRHIRRECGKEPGTWTEFLELDDDGRPVRQVVCSGPPWPSDTAAKYSREYPKDRCGELSQELCVDPGGSGTSLSPARFNFLWVAMRGGNPAAYGLTEWGEVLPKALPTLTALLLADFRYGTETWDRRTEVSLQIEAIAQRLGSPGGGESWTDLADGEYRTLRYWTLSPLLYHTWHARYPGQFPTEWPAGDDVDDGSDGDGVPQDPPVARGG